MSDMFSTPIHVRYASRRCVTLLGPVQHQATLTGSRMRQFAHPTLSFTSWSRLWTSASTNGTTVVWTAPKLCRVCRVRRDRFCPVVGRAQHQRSPLLRSRGGAWFQGSSSRLWRPRDITQIFKWKIFKPELSLNSLGPFRKSSLT